MAETPKHRPERSQPSRPRQLIKAFYAPNSYGLVLLLILVTYVLSVTLTEGRAVSLVVAVQIATVWVVLRASEAPPPPPTNPPRFVVFSSLSAGRSMLLPH